MSTGVVSWSTTAASNATADSNVNMAEGMAPSAVNDSVRALMASVAKWRDDISGGITTGGASTAYTATTNQSFASLAAMNGQIITIVPHTTSGADPTLAVDGLTAKQIRTATGVNVPTGTLVQGTPYQLVYYSSAAEFILMGFIADPYIIPVGAFLPYSSTTAPNSSFILPYGQAVSRTTYATYFTMVSTTFGVGDGSTTFNVPDLRGRSIFGLDNMGGSAASRITSAASGVDGTSLGAAGGAQTVTIARANLPNDTVTASVTDTTNYTVNNGNGLLVSGSGQPPQAGSGGTGGSVNVTLTKTGSVSATIALNGGVTQTAVNKLPPAMVLPFILRII